MGACHPEALDMNSRPARENESERIKRAIIVSSESELELFLALAQ